MVATGLFIQHAFGNDIQVSGHQEFPESRWREAILFFLFGIWGDQQSVTRRPKIIFGSVTLRLDSSKGEYYAYGRGTEEFPEFPHSFDEKETLRVTSPRQADVEVALARFVKNDRIKLLTIWLPYPLGFVALWKKSRRGQYGIATHGIPSRLTG